MAPSFEAIGQSAPRPTAARESPPQLAPKLKSGLIGDEKDGSFLRGDRSISTELNRTK
jgi:hypothetical protein